MPELTNGQTPRGSEGPAMTSPRLGLLQRWLIFARLLFAGSVPLLAWIFGVVFLLVPTQTVDLLADPSWLQTIAFLVGVSI
jgi:hypothetical protein